MNKKQIIIFIVALLILGAFVAVGFKKSEQTPVVPVQERTQVDNPAVEVDSVSINDQNQYYEISAKYPKVKSESITQYFKSYVEDQIAQFKEDTKWVEEQGGAPNGASVTLDIDYKNVSSKKVQNYVFQSYSYTGGAHGLTVRKTFNFNNQGQLLTISNIFKNGIDGLGAFAKLVQAQLLKRENAQADWIADGAGAKQENYQSFVVGNDGVTVLFDQYQVAPYSDGQIDILIRFDAFKDIVNPDILNQ